MLTKLLPEQVSKFWDVISYAVEQSLPPVVGEHPDKMNRILASALSGKITVWASYSDKKFEGIVLTKAVYDDASDTRNLLIYCLYGYNEIGKRSWLEGMAAIAKYAKSRGFNQIIAYSNSPYIVNISKHLGAVADYTLISFNTNETVHNLNKLMRE